MKYILALLLPVVLINSLFAQEIETIQKASYKLNSISRAQLGMGVDKSCFYADIPFGTSQLIIAISTNTGRTPATISLTGQVLDYYSGTTVPVFSELLRAITGTSGQASMNLYVYNDIRCAGLYTNNARSQCAPIDMSQNITGGVFYFSKNVLYQMQGRKCAFCISNNDNVRANYVTVEMTAIKE